MLSLLQTQLGRLRILAFAEGVSFLLVLFITMPLKYALKMPEPNQIVGLAHGILFVLYVLAVVQIKIEQNWKISTTFWALGASVVPFGTFWADKKIFQVLQNSAERAGELKN
jgi:integral membrane protein